MDLIKTDLNIPGDRKIALTAMLIGSIAKGTTELSNFPAGNKDCMNMLGFITKLGIKTESFEDGKRLIIHGEGLNGLKKSSDDLDIKDSEIILKLLTGILSGQKFESKIVGDMYTSMIPMDEIVTPLKNMNVGIEATDENLLPFTITPYRLHSISHELNIADVNTKACLLFSALFANGTTSITEPFASPDYTERILKSFGADIEYKREREIKIIEEDELERRIRLAKEKKSKKTADKFLGKYIVSLTGQKELHGIKLNIPGDITVASNFCVLAALSKKREFHIKNVNLNPDRNTSITLLKRMGVNIEIEKKHNEAQLVVGDIIVKSSKLVGRNLTGDSMINIIDEVPALTVAASFAEGRTVIKNIERLRSVESDCITAITENLKKMKVKVGEVPDGLVVDGDSKYSRAIFQSYSDSRVAMAFSIAGFLCNKKYEIYDIEPLKEDFPYFYEKIQEIMHNNV